ncbi:uncharacterized protein LY89DRAFT_640184 [Mollisia scopiformis]|uniref:N-acetyltransferase domain-containing protein n=1 Tax=Mollisia scopiformis TaxID=149040 RepID=A0A194XL94_MOLSC|nr:uncharacterized protein LY89DRAFT_640184 [Mollisia scopiformis]KUJ20547.1 hypothetical protein LY89DRAFT_640184 [Mollisia scopiformis]
MPYEIIQIPRDDESIRTWVEQCKAIRLYALKTAPEAFGSTYAREIAFTDEDWYNRLANPVATTCIAVQSNQIVCSLVGIGPLPCTPEESSPTKNPWELSKDPGATAQLHFRINGMFTLPEARGQGIAKALIERFFEHGKEEANKVGKNFVCSIVVDADNTPAKNLYEKCGFVSLIQETYPESSRVAILMKYPATSEKTNV